MKKAYVNVFLWLFIVLICLPMPIWFVASHFVDTQNYSNRTLAERPELLWDNYMHYASDFEKYFNDHIPFRNPLIAIGSLVDYEVFHTSQNERVIIGKDKWLFFGDENTRIDYRGEVRFSAEEKQEMYDALAPVQQYAIDNGIVFSVLVAGNKEHVYREYMPDAMPTSEMNRADDAIAYLQEQGINILSTVPVALQEKQNYQLYYQYDTHWNQLGAYIGVCQVLNRWGLETKELDQLQISSVPLKDAYHLGAEGDLAQMLNLRNWNFDFDKEYSIDESFHPSWDQYADGACHFYNENAYYPGFTVAVFGDSFKAAMIPVLGMYFSDVYVYTREECNRQLLEEINPNFMIVEIVERKVCELPRCAQMIE